MKNEKQERNSTILAEHGIDKIAFYTAGTPIVNNVFTTCVFLNTLKGSIEARGVAICSLKDSYSKKKGKQKAFGRAMQALLHMKNDLRIKATCRDDELVKRKIKVKTHEDEVEFQTVILDELRRVDPSMKIQTMKSHGYKKYFYDLPASYPMRLANNLYRYKSQFRPNPVTDEELRLLKQCAAIMSTEANQQNTQELDLGIGCRICGD